MLNESSDPLNIGIKCIFAAGQFAYLQIPTDSLRSFFDTMFPAFAKNATADVAKGFAHRWVAGHDLLIDIPRTAFKNGLCDSFSQAGHILLTDFPTKAGIPIPGLSKCGLGEFLTETCGIPKAYLCLNIMKTGVGIFAISEGSQDLYNVIANQVRMTPELFLDTFVEGGIDLVTGVNFVNPLLIFAGSEQIIAGLIATWKTITKPIWFVNPVDFFSGTLSAGLFALAFSKFVLKRKPNEIVIDTARSMTLGGLFTVSTFFGFGGVMALLLGKVGKIMADQRNKEISRCFEINKAVVDSVFTDSPLFPHMSFNRDLLFAGLCKISQSVDLMEINDETTSVDLLDFDELDVDENGVELKF